MTSAAQKRKDPPTSNSNADKRAIKRTKTHDARDIATQAVDPAIKDGALDLDSFVRARQFEIKAMHKAMGQSKGSSNARAHQTLPRDMRRRTASHNVRRLPKRLQKRGKWEMAEGRTPTIDASRRKPRSSRGWVRLDTARNLPSLAKKSKANTTAEETKTLVASMKKAESEAMKANKAKKEKQSRNAVLAEVPTPHSKFRRRQIRKTWLPTHVWHSKRAHMTSPLNPVWGFSLPQTATEKSYRPTHRATRTRSAVAWDMSYMSTIRLDGKVDSVQKLLKTLGIKDSGLWDSSQLKWREEATSKQCWIFERDNSIAIAPTRIIWCSAAARQLDDVVINEGETSLPNPKKKRRTPTRRLFLRVHPSAFLQLWREIVAVSKQQRPPVSVQDLRYELGSIEIVGPASTEALSGTLRPASKGPVQIAGEVWLSLRDLSNPALLPNETVLTFNIDDPRLLYPPQTIKHSGSTEDRQEDLLKLLDSWPADKISKSTSLFSRPAREAACRRLPSQKSINRRKGDAGPGKHPSSRPNDPKIPILLVASRPSKGSKGGQGTWTLILPWKCVLPVWYVLQHYPLSGGGTIRFGGLRDYRQVAFERGTPWFPGDYPGTKAGWGWEMRSREETRAEWERKPKRKRISWEALNLGERKGELGFGWACDWQRLFDGPSSDGTLKPVDDAIDIKTSDVSMEETKKKKAMPAQSPVGLRQLFTEDFRSRKRSNASEQENAALSTSLLAVKIIADARGRVSPCSRIYRLPTTDGSLLENWLPLLKRPRSSVKSNHIKDYQAEQRKSGVLTSKDAYYPSVPPEEDLIGFVTQGGFNLGEGNGIGLGCIWVERILDHKLAPHLRNLCIVREAGMELGRLARWELPVDGS